MALQEHVREWWVKTLLEQQTSAHPIFGSDLHVDVEGEVVTLSGTVESGELVDEIVQEAKRVDEVRLVVNHLTVVDTVDRYQMQTVVAILPNEGMAELAGRVVEASTYHEDRPPQVLRTLDEVRESLGRSIKEAQVPAETVDRYVSAVERGKVLLVDRVPEDDALRVIWALEGTCADSVHTLPPEPQSPEVES